MYLGRIFFTTAGQRALEFNKRNSFWADLHCPEEDVPKQDPFAELCWFIALVVEAHLFSVDAVLCPS